MAHSVMHPRTPAVAGFALMLAAGGVGTSALGGGTIGDELSMCTPCVGDLNGDGAVDGADLGTLLQSWGVQSGGDCGVGVPCGADLNGDGQVDGADLGLMLAAWGECETFDYPPFPDWPDGEAYQIALEVLGPNGGLLPSDELVERVARDLDLIRAATPMLADQFHTPAFQWDFLILSRNQAADASSCDCHHLYTFSVTGVGEVTLLSVTQVGAPYCEWPF